MSGCSCLPQTTQDDSCTFFGTTPNTDGVSVTRWAERRSWKWRSSHKGRPPGTSKTGGFSARCRAPRHACASGLNARPGCTFSGLGIRGLKTGKQTVTLCYYTLSTHCLSRSDLRRAHDSAPQAKSLGGVWRGPSPQCGGPAQMVAPISRKTANFPVL